MSCETVPPITPAHLTRFVAVQTLLGPERAKLVREWSEALSPIELRAWLGELSYYSLPIAVMRTRIRFQF